MIHLLLINGWSAKAGFWQDFIADLSSSFTCEVIDLDQEKTLSEWLGLIDQSMRENTVLIGWSLGGSLAIQYAASTKKTFLALVTLQTNPCFIAQSGYTDAMNANEFRALNELVSDEQGKRKMLVRHFSHLLVNGSLAHKKDRRSLKQNYDELSLPNAVVLRSGLSILADLDVRQALTQVSQPCLHIYGRYDALVPVEVSNSVQKNNPHHQVYVINDMGHLPCCSYRAEVISGLEKFLEGVCRDNFQEYSVGEARHK